MCAISSSPTAYFEPRSMLASMFARSWPPNNSPYSLNHHFGVHLLVHSSSASMWVFQLAWLWPPRSPDYSLQVQLYTSLIMNSECSSHMIMASIWTSNYAQLRPRSHYHTHSITVFEYVSEFAPSWCGATVELEASQSIINTPPHLAWHPEGIIEEVKFCLEECRQTVRGYELVASHDSLHTLCGSMHAWEDCMRNHTNCVDLWRLGMSAWDEEQRKILCEFHIMRWYISSSWSPQYILPVTEFISVFPISLYVYI